MSAPTLHLKSLGVCLLLAAGVVGAVPARSQGARRRALLVAVGDYTSAYATRKDRTAWPSLHSALDADNMRQVLTSRYGFRDADILTLKDAQATRAGILQAFRTWLIEGAGPGDLVVFHYSGHGQQVRDQNGDEPDGLDEALVPYDYVSGRAADNASVAIRDEELGALLRELNTKRGPTGSVLCAIDCCHAGTVTRGALSARGRGWDERVDGPAPQSRLVPDADLLPPQGSGWVAFSACQSYEPALEEQDERGKPLGGAFTYQLCAALREAGPRTTYRDLLERVRTEVKARRPLQTPGAEGDLDRLLFSGAVRPAESRPVVRSVREGEVELSFGRLHGVTEGSRYALYPPDAEKPVASAVVRSVDLYTSRAALAGAAPAGLVGARAVLTERGHPVEPLRVLAAEPDLSRLLQAETRGDGPLAVVAAGAYDVRVARAGKLLEVDRDDGVRLASLPAGPEAAGALRERLIAFWRWRLLAGLQPSGGASLPVELRVVPVRVAREGDRVRILGDRTDLPTRAPLALKAGDFLRIEAANPSSQAVHVTVFNLQSDGTVAPVFPDPASGAIEENRIRGGGVLKLPGAFEVGEPFGTDLFKVIATRDKVDFSPLFYTARGLTRGQQQARLDQAEASVRRMPPSAGPLGRLLLGAVSARRAPAQVDPSVWGTAAVAIETRAR